MTEQTEPHLSDGAKQLFNLFYVGVFGRHPLRLVTAEEAVQFYWEHFGRQYHGSVYVVVRDGHPNEFKIGMSIDPCSRLCDLQAGSPDRLRFAYVHRCRRAPASDVELLAHRLMVSSGAERLIGEWFRLPRANFAAIINEADAAASFDCAERERTNPPLYTGLRLVDGRR